jgi:hypothetical protein
MLPERAAQAQHQESFIDPAFERCSGGATWSGTAWGGNDTATSDVDHDGSSGTGENEATGDSVFGTIAFAVGSACGAMANANCTNTGGTVHLLVPGVYRENVTITRSMTLRAPEGTEVILDGNNALCATPSSMPSQCISFNPTTNGSTLILENITFRGWTGANGALFLTGTDNFVKLVNCRFEANDVAVLVNTTGNTLEVVTCTFVNNTGDIVALGSSGNPTVVAVASSTFMNGSIGIELDGVGSLAVSDSTFMGFTGYGIASIDTGGTNQWTVSVAGSRFLANDAAIKMDSNELQALQIVDSVIEQSAVDGVYFRSSINLAQVGVDNSRFLANGGDGLEVSASGSGVTVTAHLARNGFFSNASAGYRATTASGGTVTTHCELGNVTGGNASSFSGATCTTIGAHANQNH